jgi:hypothetical protein
MTRRTSSGHSGSAQVEVSAGGHERFDRLGGYAGYAFDIGECAVVVVLLVQPGHGGDVLFDVRWQACLCEHLGAPRP